MSVIQDVGYQVLVGKYQAASHFQQAMFQGRGLRYAETLVKDTRLDNPYLLSEKIIPNSNFEGFECRWNEIPSSQEETVAIMVQVLDHMRESEEMIRQEIAGKITEIYGNEASDHPLQLRNMSLTYSLKKLSIETRIRTSLLSVSQRFRYLFRLVFFACAGKYLMDIKDKSASDKWGEYKQNLIENTDYRKFDEILRMVISGSLVQRNLLIEYLNNLFERRMIVFGIHPSPGAIITCLISNYEKDHVHFLNGSNGGYAMAARNMKQQLKTLKTV